MVTSVAFGAEAPWHVAAPGAPGCGAGAGDGADADEPPSGGPAGVPWCCCPQPEASTTAPMTTAARAGTLRIADSFRSRTSPVQALDAAPMVTVPGDHLSWTNRRTPFSVRTERSRVAG